MSEWLERRVAEAEAAIMATPVHLLDPAGLLLRRLIESERAKPCSPPAASLRLVAANGKLVSQ